MRLIKTTLFAVPLLTLAASVHAAVVIETTSLTTTEDGSSVEYRVYLDSAPDTGETVTVTPSSGDVTEGTVSGALDFTAANWYTPQTVTVTPGASGDGNDGDVMYSITNDVSSTGGAYDSATADPTSVTNSNIDGIATILIDPASGFAITEGGSGQTITFSTTFTPSADVSVDLTAPPGISLSASTVTLSAGNSYEATVTVSATDNSDADGDVPFSITTDAAVSSDIAYNGVDPNDISGLILDDDFPGMGEFTAPYAAPTPLNPPFSPEIITDQATENIAGDTITLGNDPALRIGDRVVFTVSNGATFADTDYSLEESLGGAGTGALNFAVLETATPSGSSSIAFRMQESPTVARSLAGADGFILSGDSISGQAVNFNLPEPGVDITLTVEVFTEGTSRGTDTITMFESSLPSAPTNLSVVQGDGQATITFTAPDDNGSPITNYAYSTDGVNYTPLSPADADSPITITGLQDGVNYSFTLRAINGNGQGAASQALSVSFPAQPIPALPLWALAVLAGLVGTLGYSKARKSQRL